MPTVLFGYLGIQTWCVWNLNLNLLGSLSGVIGPSFSQSFFLELLYIALKMYRYFSICFAPEELKRKEIIFCSFIPPTETKFDLLYFWLTCKKVHKRVFKTQQIKILLLIYFHSHCHLLTVTILSLQDRIYCYVPNISCSPFSLQLILEVNSEIELNFSCSFRTKDCQKDIAICISEGIVICRASYEERAALCPQALPGNTICTLLGSAQSCSISVSSLSSSWSLTLESLLQHRESQAMLHKHCLHFAKGVTVVCLLFQPASFVAVKKGKRDKNSPQMAASRMRRCCLFFPTFSFVESFLLLCCFNFILLALSQ